jgi:hypothetical protein
MYTITATPYSKAKGKGMAGLRRTITFEVVDDGGMMAGKTQDTGENARKTVSTSSFATDQFSISVYPNPVADRFSFNFSGEAADNVSVMIYTLNGKLLGTQQRQVDGPSVVEVGVQDFQLQPGVYLVKVVTENAASSVFRIVKN